MVLPIEVARLCPDCDILTEAPTCPQCGRDGTFPLAAWMGRLDHRGPVPGGTDHSLSRPEVGHGLVR